MAKLHAATDLELLEIRGLFALLDTLEDDVTSEAANNLVPAATVWIAYAGEKLKANNINYASHKTKNPKKNGRRGPMGISIRDIMEASRRRDGRSGERGFGS